MTSTRILGLDSWMECGEKDHSVNQASNHTQTTISPQMTNHMQESNWSHQHMDSHTIIKKADTNNCFVTFSTKLKARTKPTSSDRFNNQCMWVIRDTSHYWWNCKIGKHNRFKIWFSTCYYFSYNMKYPYWTINTVPVFLLFQLSFCSRG